MAEPREVPNGVYRKRKRCVCCNELTWSTWFLGYVKDEKWFEGIHCYTCHDEVYEKFNSN